MQAQHNGIDEIRCPAVVIHHTDLGNGFQQRLVLHLIRAIGIHNHQNTAVVALKHGLLSGQKHILVFRHLKDLLQQALGGVVFQIQDDIGLLAPLPAQAADAHSRTQGIHIGVSVSHDEHPAALADQLHQGVGRDTGTNLAAVGGFLIPAAVEGEVETILHNGLITAAAQSHFNTQGSKVVALIEVGAVYPQTDGNGGSQTRGTENLMDLLQKGKLVLRSPQQIPLFKDKQEPVPLQLPKQAVILLRPLGDSIVELGV